LEGIDLTVTRSGAAVPVCGNFTFNGQSGAYTTTNTSNTITFDWTTKPSLSGSAEAFGTVFPKIEAGDELKFVIRTTSHTATVTVTAKVNFQPNTLYTFPLTLNKLTDKTVVEGKGEDSGDSGDSGSQEGTPTLTGTFTCATYNVDGLPSLFDNADGPGSSGTTSISQKIANDNWDIIGFSEDFDFHDELASNMSAYTFGKYRGSVSAANALSAADTDGLGFATKNSTCSFSNENIVAFTSSYGGLTSGANTCIKKGFRHYVVTLTNGIAIDVIIIHMNTYSSSGTSHINAQHAQLKQIAQYINSIRSNNRPIIFMGDTNCRYTRHDFYTYFWSVLDSDLVVKDPWVEYQWDGVYPTYGGKSLMVSDATGTNSSTDIICENTQKGEVVDKVIYINNPDSPVQIKANNYLRDYDGYNGMADHMPIIVEFSYMK
jgi:exonuclease III